MSQMFPNTAPSQTAAAPKSTNMVVLVLGLVCCWPAGLWFMWKERAWSARTRWIITAFFALIAVGQIADALRPPDADRDGIIDVEDCSPNDASMGTARAEDHDCDGTPNKLDCKPEDGAVATEQSEDSDCDGIANSQDCAPKNSKVRVPSRSKDSDCDGILNAIDCNPTGSVDDLDCDGAPNETDCARTDKAISTLKSADSDCDGTPTEVDCAPDDPKASIARTDDTDCDGVLNETDCDPAGHTNDLDCDGVDASVDCDDSDAKIKTKRAADSDCDGILNEKDCAPSDKGNDTFDCLAPKSQRNFCTAIEVFRDRYIEAASTFNNDMAITAVRFDRGRALSRAVPGGQFRQWVGVIKKISTFGTGGKGKLAITLPCKAELTTWGNMATDFGYDTLIPPNSELYHSVSLMAEGQTVKVSGRLLADPLRRDGFLVKDMTEAGTMFHTAEFVVKFSAVAP